MRKSSIQDMQKEQNHDQTNLMYVLEFLDFILLETWLHFEDIIFSQ